MVAPLRGTEAKKEPQSWTQRRVREEKRKKGGEEEEKGTRGEEGREKKCEGGRKERRDEGKYEEDKLQLGSGQKKALQHGGGTMGMKEKREA